MSIPSYETSFVVVIVLLCVVINIELRVIFVGLAKLVCFFYLSSKNPKITFPKDAKSKDKVTTSKVTKSNGHSHLAGVERQSHLAGVEFPKLD
jgi:hypothetical protein